MVADVLPFAEDEAEIVCRFGECRCGTGISLDWLDRCLRIASGLLPATAQRRAEARKQAASELAAFPARIAIVTDLSGWLSS